jgi:hypothetical protein
MPNALYKNETCTACLVHVAVQPIYNQPFKTKLLLHVPPALILKETAYFPQSAFIDFVKMDDHFPIPH